MELLRKFLFLFLGIAFIAGVAWWINSQPNLPPIDIAGHVEDNPNLHAISEPMPEPIQKHMLEHADGEGKPGIIIQYNCSKPYICEPGLADKLKNVVKKYPENVYLAPGNYDGKIILTRFGQREILDKLDQKKIEEFINAT